MSPRLRRLAGAAAVCAVVIIAVTFVPRALRGLKIFQVQTVRVMGTQHMAPHEVLALTGITVHTSVFDDPSPWREALLDHPLVAEAEVRRELPRTLVLRVQEAEPIALVPMPMLQPVDADGRVLPIDPATSSLDLPVVASPSSIGDAGRLDDAASLRLVRHLAELRRFDPELAARISALAVVPDGSVRMQLLAPAGADVLMPGDRDLEFHQIRLVLAELESRGEADRLRAIDLRYRDQVVVSLNPSVN